MHQRIWGWSNVLVNCFLIPLTVISLVGALTLIWPAFQALSQPAIAVLDMLVVVGVVVGFQPRLRKWLVQRCQLLINWGVRHRQLLLRIVIVITVLWQISLAVLLAGNSIWDPQTIIQAAMQRLPSDDLYFSYYPNTLGLLFVEHGVWLLSGRPTLIFFTVLLNLINIILIDSGIWLVGRVVREIWGNQSVRWYYGCAWLLLMLSPWVALPYSDTWAFWLTSLNLWTLYRLIKAKKVWWQVTYAGIFGLLLVASYVMKPSLVITSMAIILVGAVKLLAVRGRYNFKRLSLILLVIMGVSAGGYFGHHELVRRQSIVTIKSGLAHPMAHFAAMGLLNRGGFNDQDVQADRQIKNPKARQRADVQLIRQRLKQFGGPLNYQKFLMQKQTNNTSDGTFGWGVDGIFIDTFGRSNPTIYHWLNRTPQRRLFAKNGVARNDVGEYRFGAQFVWIVCLVCLLATARIKTAPVQLLKYAITGFWLFLLLFEGGRSRYMIQLLPLILALAAVGGPRIGDWSRNWWSRVTKRLS